jgi:hypothetical protein
MKLSLTNLLAELRFDEAPRPISANKGSEMSTMSNTAVGTDGAVRVPVQCMKNLRIKIQHSADAVCAGIRRECCLLLTRLFIGSGTDETNRELPKPGTALSCMRNLFPILALLSFAQVHAFGGTSNHVVIVIHRGQTAGQFYEWRVSETRLLATPEWSIDATAIPIAPGKAWQIAKNWFEKRGEPRPDFVKIEICPVVPETEATRLDDRLRKRFYYRVECSSLRRIEDAPKKLDYTSVIVLMDGTVVEPKLATEKGEM